MSKLPDYCFSQRNCSLLRCNIKGRACCAENRLKQDKLLDVPLCFVLFSCNTVILAKIASWQEINTTYKYFEGKSLIRCKKKSRILLRGKNPLITTLVHYIFKYCGDFFG